MLSFQGPTPEAIRITMPERHYSDDEVAAIFRAAAEGAESRAVAGDHIDGLTLRDLQAIAGEVGLSPLAIARAAQALDHPARPVISQTFLGLPIAVERTVPLDRPLTELEWERLVVELRRVFRARGTVRGAGSLREWSNGNLHAMLEPTSTGYQLRLGTLKGDARASVAAGVLTLGMSLATAVLVGVNGTLAQAAPGLAALGTLGAALIANGTLRLPSWARRRREQMDGIVERLTSPPDDSAAG
jgi:hypothetical protein